MSTESHQPGTDESPSMWEHASHGDPEGSITGDESLSPWDN